MTDAQVQQAREAFEDHYQRCWDDPSSSQDLEVWMAAWARCLAQEGKP